MHLNTWSSMHVCKLTWVQCESHLELSHKSLFQSLFKSTEQFLLILYVVVEVQKEWLWMFLCRRQVINFYRNWWNPLMAEVPIDIPDVHLDNQLYILFNDQEAMLINLEIPLWIIYHQLNKVSQTVHFSDILTCYWDILGNVHSFFIQTSVLSSVPAGVHRPTLPLSFHMQAN